MSRTLQPEDQISHYRVVGPLGAGGMGEVYIAQDKTLERSVALKVLPHSLVQNEERVRRFIKEAKSASSLNHPHIITIYEIGHDQVLAGDGSPAEPDSAPIHFISMELVTGETLTHKIHGEKADLKTLLGYLSQAAEGLAKAHNAGIVHRDLKPANIMISKDGYAKILDFGLAKLTEKHAAEDGLSSAPTEMSEKTGEGIVMGTVGYMAPEQVRGKSVDHRADVFAFGCILYEAATRKRPFTADTDVETMHLILNEKPQPVEELNPGVPTEVRRAIRRCLAKNPDQRFQSMKDLAIELREIVEEYDELTVSGTSAVTGLSGPAAAQHKAGMGLKLGIAAAVIVGLAGIAFGLRGFMSGGGSSAPDAASGPFGSVEIKTLFSRPDLGHALLSPDGRFLAYVDGPGNKRNLKIRQVATGSDVTVLADQEASPYGIFFSPDGTYLYFLARDREFTSYAALYQVASLGGTPRKKIFDCDSGPTFAPDGKRIAFRRGKPDEGRDTIFIADLESGEEREFASVKLPPENFINEPAWSPDGSRIATAIRTQEGGTRVSISVYDADTGEKSGIPGNEWGNIESIRWTPDGTAFVLVAKMGIEAGGLQIYYVDYPSGSARKITNDLSTYGHANITNDGRTISTVRTNREANLWAIEARIGATPSQLTFGSGTSSAVGSIRSAGAGAVLFSQPVDGLWHIWTMNLDGSGKRQLTSGDFRTGSPIWVPDGELIVFERNVGGKDRTRHIWRMNRDGGDMRQLTQGTGEQLVNVSRDGRWVYFSRFDTDDVLFRMPTEGGPPEKFIDAQSFVRLSRDGRLLVYFTLENDGDRMRNRVHVIPSDGGDPVAEFFDPADTLGEELIPDGSGWTYHLRSDQGKTLRRSDLEAKNERILATVETGRIIDHSWSWDEKWIQVHVRVGAANSLWIVPSEGGKMEKLLEFPTGDLFNHGWNRDSRHIYFAHGNTSREVVQISETHSASN